MSHVAISHSHVLVWNSEDEIEDNVCMGACSNEVFSGDFLFASSK